MCLYVDSNARIQTAKEDIEVFKVVALVECRWLGVLGTEHYVTPFKWRRVKIPGTIVMSEPQILTVEVWWGHCVIERGVHSFQIKEDAIQFAEGRSSWRSSSYSKSGWTHVPVKAIIPKGAKYVKGSFKAIGFEDFPSYVSTELRLIEVVR